MFSGEHLIKENEIVDLPHEYLVFIDETGDPFFHSDIKTYEDPSVYPTMTVLALIVPRVMYKKVMMVQMDEIKDSLFGTKAVYFHSREIRRKDGIYKIFLDEVKYSSFKKAMVEALEQSFVTIISCSINKLKLLQKATDFKEKTGVGYKIGDLYLCNVDYILERVGHFLGGKSAKIIFESRGKTESLRIQGVLTEAKNNGTFYCPKERFDTIDEKILFFNKKDNVNGLQMADYCVYPFARHARNKFDLDNKFFELLRKYIYKGQHSEYGLKEWP